MSRFDADYREELTLDDGTRLRIRAVRPSDKHLLAEGLARLSPESRYRRFFTAKDSLSPAELRYLTEVDGNQHFAIGAVRLDADGGEADGVAVARFVRFADEPSVAEPAVAVIDELQGRGLGKLLMRRLVEAAAERGIDRFRSEVLAQNRAARTMLERTGDGLRFEGTGPVVVAEIPIGRPLPALATEHPDAEPSPMNRLLRLAAEELVAIRRAFVLLAHPEEWLDEIRKRLR